MKGVLLAAASVTLLLQGDSADAIRDRLDTYLIAYEPLLSSLVAEEHMSQRDGPSKYAMSRTAEPSKYRRTTSEVAFVGLPGDVGWMGLGVSWR